jgi:endonuclease/exonuclease/phosphatase family metal-dependent hydrolase
LREIRGKLFKIPRGSNTPEIIASGRDDWDGFIEMKRTEVKSAAVRNTGLVLQALNADVVALMEVEDRTALKRFSEDILGPLDGQVAYDRYMLIDGNDERGIDVGLFSRFPIVNICSHVDAGLPASRIFSRDCAEYEVALDNGDRLWIMVNHFKSKGFGNAAANNARRLAQAEEVARLYTKRLETHDLVIVAGDLNDTPTSAPLAPLVQNTDLRDAMSHPTYTSKPGVRPGTFGTGTPRNKIDYLLLSPKLWDKVHDVDVERRGVWAPNTFPHFDEVDGPLTAASDHAAVWADLDIN